jgi:hypothetical protein
MSKILASETPFSIGGVTRPPPGAQGVSIQYQYGGGFDPVRYGLFLDGFPFDAAPLVEGKVGANHPVQNEVKNIRINGHLYPRTPWPDSPVTAQQVLVAASFNSNSAFSDFAQGVSATVSVFEIDGVTPINCMAPSPDPNAVDGHIFQLDYNQTLASDAALDPVRANCPLLTATTRKFSINLSLAAQTANAGPANRFFFLPAAETYYQGFVINWDIILKDSVGSYVVSNFQQVYTFAF